MRRTIARRRGVPRSSLRSSLPQPGSLQPEMPYVSTGLGVGKAEDGTCLDVYTVPRPTLLRCSNVASFFCSHAAGKVIYYSCCRKQQQTSFGKQEEKQT